MYIGFVKKTDWHEPQGKIKISAINIIAKYITDIVCIKLILMYFINLWSAINYHIREITNLM